MERTRGCGPIGIAANPLKKIVTSNQWDEKVLAKSEETCGRERQDRGNRREKTGGTVFAYGPGSRWRREAGCGVKGGERIGRDLSGDRWLSTRLVKSAVPLGAYPGRKTHANPDSDGLQVIGFDQTGTKARTPGLQMHATLAVTGTGFTIGVLRFDRYPSESRKAGNARDTTLARQLHGHRESGA